MPLQQDALQYVQLSQSMHWFYDTDHREPLPAWIIKCLSFIFPIPPDVTATGYLPIRLFTILLSSLIPVLVYGIGKQWFTHRVAALSAWILVIDKALIYRSLQGLREELLTVGALLVLQFALTRIPDRKIKFLSPLVLGISSGLLLLVRTACLPYVGFLLAAGWWLKTYTWKECAVALLILLMIASPYYIYCKYQFGDFMYSGNYHLNKFYYMTVLHHDDPNITQFPFVSSSDLMFKIFPWYRSLQFFVEGFLDTFFGRYALRLLFVPASVLGIGCTIMGYFLWLQECRKRILLISLLLLLGPMAFVMGMLNHSPITFDWRTVVHLTPFLAYSAAEGWFFLISHLPFRISMVSEK